MLGIGKRVRPNVKGRDHSEEKKTAQILKRKKNSHGERNISLIMFSLNNNFAYILIYDNCMDYIFNMFSVLIKKIFFFYFIDHVSK